MSVSIHIHKESENGIQGEGTSTKIQLTRIIN
jgi:hypothetical protein